jgi:hypothetical protein
MKIKQVITYKYILLCLVSTMGSTNLFSAQMTDTLPLLQSLRAELFPSNETRMSILEYPNCQVDEIYYYKYNLDSSAMVRQNQPKYERVTQIFTQIMDTKDVAYLPYLLEYYDMHQENFKKEWASTHFKGKFYCKGSTDQIAIMHGFEEIITFFNYVKSNISDRELEDLFDIYIKDYYKAYYDYKYRLKLIQEKSYHSEYFKRVLQRIGIINDRFTLFSGFVDRLEDHFADIILKTKGADFAASKDLVSDAAIQSMIAEHVIHLMQEHKSRKFEQALEKSFDEFAKSGYVVRIFEYVQHNNEVSPQFIRFLLDKIYTHEHFKHDLQVQESFTGILGYMLNTHTRPVILEYLMERTEAKKQEDRLRTWSYLVYFTNEPEVLQLMLDKSRQKNLSVEERKVLANNFQRMLKAEDFPQEQKKKVEQQYNKMRYETRQE